MAKKATQSTTTRKAPLPQSPTQLRGSWAPSWVLVPNLLLGLFMSPLLIIGGTLIYGGLQNAAQQASMSLDLWCLQLVGGIGFIGLWCYVIWKWCLWAPSITISQFELRDQRLTVHTTKWGILEIAVDEVLHCHAQRSKRGITGWWLRLKDHGWLFLQRDYSGGQELAHLLMKRSRKAVPPS